MMKSAAAPQHNQQSYATMEEQRKLNSVYNEDEDDNSSAHTSIEQISLGQQSNSIIMDENHDVEPADLSPHHELKFDWGQLVSLIQNGRKFCEPPSTEHGSAPRARAVTADSEASFGRDLVTTKNLIPTDSKRNLNNNEEGDDWWDQALERVTKSIFQDSKVQETSRQTVVLEDITEEETDDDEEAITAVVVSEYESETESPWVVLERLFTAVIMLYLAYACMTRMGLRLEFEFDEV
mmetsp:Transcript_31099/g.73001  ORF Transcript_31099/g.73001 Transcript_31099/m.73001 type:complete len:237 (+) Transcript_31099:226-936(+)